MYPSIFKAYDIRGAYPDEINEKTVEIIASAVAKKFSGKIVVGYDARLSSPALYKAALSGFSNSYRTNKTYKSDSLIKAGLITTPMLYFLVNKLKASGGIMITASHNPKNFNGLKVVGPKAAMISGTDILKWVPLETGH